jgi:hypothetical protein
MRSIKKVKELQKNTYKKDKKNLVFFIFFKECFFS